MVELILPRQSVERWLKAGILLAVSGGADSVALFRYFVDMKKTTHPDAELAVAHLNHGLRGGGIGRRRRFC